MAVTAIVGRRGTGKTNYATRLLKSDYEGGRKLITNLRSLQLPQVYMSIDDICENFGKLRSATILIDEIQVGADSRQSMSERNRALNIFMTQLRKRDIVLIYTTQFFQDIDNRIKRQTDYIVKMENIYEPDVNKPTRKVKSESEFLVAIYDRENMKALGEPNHIFNFNGRKYWKYYDTEEIILPDGSIVGETTYKTKTPDDSKTENNK